MDGIRRVGQDVRGQVVYEDLETHELFVDLDGDGARSEGDAVVTEVVVDDFDHNGTPDLRLLTGSMIYDVQNESLEASTRSRELLGSGPVSDPGGFRENVVDVPGSQQAVGGAQEAVAENAFLEATLLGALPPDDRAAYEALRVHVEADPTALLALQVLLFDGQIPGAPALGGDHPTLVDALLDLAELSETIDGVDAQALLPVVLREVAQPTSITQGDVGSCGGVTASLYLASTAPAEYVRLVEGLAHDGDVRAANGDELEVQRGALGRDDHFPSPSQQLLVPAIMEKAGWLEYSGSDGSYRFVIDLRDGMNGFEMTSILQVLTGQSFNDVGEFAGFPIGGPLQSTSEREAVEKVSRALDEGKLVVAALDFVSGGHYVVVTGFAQLDTNDDGTLETVVTYLNPWGTEESMTVAEFRSRVDYLAYPD